MIFSSVLIQETYIHIIVHTIIWVSNLLDKSVLNMSSRIGLWCLLWLVSWFNRTITKLWLLVWVIKDSKWNLLWLCELYYKPTTTITYLTDQSESTLISSKVTVARSSFSREEEELYTACLILLLYNMQLLAYYKIKLNAMFDIILYSLL